MHITPTMDIYELREHMGNASTQEARIMRRKLAQQYIGQDTKDVPSSEWLELLMQSAGEVVDATEYNYGTK